MQLTRFRRLVDANDDSLIASIQVQQIFIGEMSAHSAYMCRGGLEVGFYNVGKIVNLGTLRQMRLALISEQ